MAKTINRLSARTVETVKGAGLHADGGGLYLSTTNGGRRWVFVFRWHGKRREMGLGSARDVSLARARELAASARSLIAEGKDPIAERRAAALRGSIEPAVEAPPLTFGQFTEEYIASVEDGWRNATHRQQWRNSLRDHASLLSDKALAEIDTDDVLAVLQPVWMIKPETASRVRGRIERILAAAKARGLRQRDSANPAQWKGHLDVLLPKQPRLSRGHHAAMSYLELPSFIADLRSRTATAARALEFLILNAARSGEVLGARWQEVKDNLWSVPAARMKGGLPHTVPLSSRALHVLTEVGGRKDTSLIFSSGDNRALSNMAMTMLIRRMGVNESTIHGFRSAFKDWALNETNFPDEMSEEALAHTIGSKVRRAYRRGEALERRRKLMEDWATYLSEPK